MSDLLLSVRQPLQRIGFLEPKSSGFGCFWEQRLQKRVMESQGGMSQPRTGYSPSLCLLPHPSFDRHRRLSTEEATGQKAMAASARRPAWLKDPL